MSVSTKPLAIADTKGETPELAWISPNELRIEPAYQRAMVTSGSKQLVRDIAENWNWSLCQPLTVARRAELGRKRLFVVDGQHRLAGARLRGSIEALPCAIYESAALEDEAQAFVALNSKRRALTPIELFRASLAGGDVEAIKLQALLHAAGLEVAPHTNATAWKPGQIGCLGGLRQALRKHGEPATEAGLRAFADAFHGQVLRYAGSIVSGVIALAGDLLEKGQASENLERLRSMLVRRPQEDWRRDAMQARIDFPGLGYGDAAVLAIRRAWEGLRVPGQVTARALPTPTPTPTPTPAAPVRRPAISIKNPVQPDGPRWCSQCDMRVSASVAAGCKSPFCKAKDPS